MTNEIELSLLLENDWSVVGAQRRSDSRLQVVVVEFRRFAARSFSRLDLGRAVFIDEVRGPAGSKLDVDTLRKYALELAQLIRSRFSLKE